MWTQITVLILSYRLYVLSEEHLEPVLYYYGLEESERSLPPCSARQACSALLQRYWRAPALVRLCRCARRTRCDLPVAPDAQLPLNNRALFQFCKPTTNWPMCSSDDIPLTVETLYDRINPIELEELHHKNIQLIPPKIIFKCQCKQPKYWKLNETLSTGDTQSYQCVSLPPCNSGEFCGNVSNDLYALYQSCLCPKHHMCIQNGGLAQIDIAELLYRGKGWKAYCIRTNEDYSYEEY